MMCLLRPSSYGAWQLALAGALVISLSGCALVGCAPTTEPANPWADFRPAPTAVASASPDEKETVASLARPPAAEPAPAIDLAEPSHRLNRDADERRTPNVPQSRTAEYPPPAPPAEDAEAVAATGSESSPDVLSHWSGAIIYCQPGCVPCAMQIRDLRKAGWKCGVSDRNHFKLVELLTLADFQKRSVPSTPQTVYFVDGVEQPPRITGYGGTQEELTRIAGRHPSARKGSRIGTAEAPAYTSPLWYDAPLYSVPVLANCGTPLLAPNCSTPNATSANGASNCGSPGYTTTIYDSPPVVTSVTYCEPVYAYATPIAYRAWPSCGVTLGPATHAAQLSLFGFPLIGGSIGTTVNW
jgi:hypothetical protein